MSKNTASIKVDLEDLDGLVRTALKCQLEIIKEVSKGHDKEIIDAMKKVIKYYS